VDNDLSEEMIRFFDNWVEIWPCDGIPKAPTEGRDIEHILKEQAVWLPNARKANHLQYRI
jgi:hypothetical protein